MGARQIEKPVQQPGTPSGTRENGGFWYALNGPLILGVMTFNREAARSLLRKMTFDNFARLLSGILDRPMERLGFARLFARKDEWSL